MITGSGSGCRAAAALLFAGLLTISGCSTENSTPATALPYELPDLIQYTYRWSAEPGIDLFGSPETAVRAYLESYYIASFAHSTAAGYPGYEEAIRNLAYNPPRRDINDRSNYTSFPLIGTLYAHILSINETEHGAQVVVCQGNYSVMTAVPDGSYSNLGSRIPSPFVIEMTSPPDETPRQLPTTGGRAQAPQTNMFGGWSITLHAFSTGNFDDNLACESKFPDPPEIRPQRTSETLSTPYPTLPPYPGWPVPTP